MGCRPSKTSPTGTHDQDGSSQKPNVVNQRKINKKVPSTTYVGQISTEQPDVLGHFPDPTKVPIVEFIQQKNVNYVKVEDTFWSKKKALIPSYSMLENIDNHVLKAPDSLRSSPEKLVNYLLKPCKTDVEQVRVLIRWIGNNIAYDVVGRDDKSKADCSVEGVLRNKIAICEGYATVVQMFCQLANIEAEKISGQTKNGEHLNKDIRMTPESDHAWNRIKMNGDWFLVDSTWCAGTVGDDVFKKKWNEWWFMTDPEAFVETHLPMARDGSLLTELQMVQAPWQSSAKWDEKAERKPAAYQFGISPLSHPERMITTKQNELTIKYHSEAKLSHYVNIYFKNGSNLEKVNASWCVMYELDGIIFANIRFQHAGVYHVKFGAEVKEGDDAITGTLQSLLYRISFEGKGAKPYPKALYGKLGLQAAFYNSGFQLIHPRSPIISTSTGLATVTLQLPTTGVVSNTVRFYDASDSGKKEVPGLLYGQKKGKMARYFIQCPEKGEYAFAVASKCKKGETLQWAAVLLISCTNVNSPVYHHPVDVNVCVQLAGPNSHFYDLGLTTNQYSSKVAFVDDVAVLHIKKTKPVVLSVKLKSQLEVNSEELLKKDETKEQLKITVDKPNIPGYYWLVLYAKDEKQEGLLPYAGCFCLPYKVPFHQQIQKF